MFFHLTAPMEKLHSETWPEEISWGPSVLSGTLPRKGLIRKSHFSHLFFGLSSVTYFLD